MVVKLHFRLQVRLSLNLSVEFTALGAAALTNELRAQRRQPCPALSLA